MTDVASMRTPLLAFPAKAGIHFCYGHRLSPVKRDLVMVHGPVNGLRPAYFIQNDLMFRDALKAGIYPMPIGGVVVTMEDIRDIADAAMAELLRRERVPHPLPRTTIELVGPDTLTGAEVTAIRAPCWERGFATAAMTSRPSKTRPRNIRGRDRSFVAELPRFRGGGSRELVARIGCLHRNCDMMIQ